MHPLPRSEALRYCDELSPEGACAASRLYGNRALCLLRLSPPAAAAAADDASCAIACDPGFGKAFYRRACARQVLGEPAAALKDAEQALQLQQQEGGDMGELQGLVATLEQAAALAAAAPAAEANGHANGHDGDASTAPYAAAGSVDQLVGAAAPALGVEYTEVAGRCLAAGEALPAGQDVLREAPFAWALTKQGRRSCCAVCCKPLARAPPAAVTYCRHCAVASYCSLACRNADVWHAPGGPECGCWGPWTVLLPTRALLALRLVRQLQSQAGSAAAELAASLETHFTELPRAEALRQAALAVVATGVWQAAQERVLASSRAGAAGGNITAAEVLAALCQVAINGLAIVPPDCARAEDRLGLGIYPVAALLNHSCEPNVGVRFEVSTFFLCLALALPLFELLVGSLSCRVKLGIHVRAAFSSCISNRAPPSWPAR